MNTPGESRPRLAIIGTRGYPSFYGGFETAVRHLAPGLVDLGWDVTVYGRPGASSGRGDARVHTRTTAGVESRSLSTLSFGFTSTLDAVLRDFDVALVMNVANGFWLPLLKMRGIKAVVNVDGIEWERDKWGKLARRIFRWGAALTARFADELVVDARAIGSRWTELFGRRSSFIAYGAKEEDALDVPLGLARRRYVLAVARFVPENTIEEFLRAAEDLAQDHDVVIVGSTGYGGPLEARARQLADTHERVHWLGHVSDDKLLHALWQHAGAYFHGHSVGGTNPALVQAMMLGAPVVARDTVYNREVLTSEGGVFVPPSKVAIAEAIAGVLADEELQNRLSREARTRARAEYSWEGIIASYHEVLRRQLPEDRFGSTE